ncbi:MAG: hypothetical protein HQL63_10220 [Magnetococcales bacterium]|nr:hypothetical protein [Magnetococcales bacterium]
MPSRKENKDPNLRPLMVYGHVVVSLFSPSAEMGSDICLLPTQSSGRISSEEGYKRFYSRTQETWTETLRAVAILRDKLVEERRQIGVPDPSQLRDVRTPVLDCFSAFQDALIRGNEENIISNPFYLLMKMIFHLNMQASQELFKETIKTAIHEHYKINIYHSDTDSTLKPFISSIILIVSMLSVYLEVNLLLPCYNFIEAIGAIIGLIFSVAILDFKNRLLSGIAEKKQFNKGIVYCFMVGPRRFIISILLILFTIFSIHNNVMSFFYLFFETEKSLTETGVCIDFIRIVFASDYRQIFDIFVVIIATAVIFGEVFLYFRQTVAIEIREEQFNRSNHEIIPIFLEKFTDSINGFFEQREISISLLSWLPRPSKLLIRNSLFIWLCGMSCGLKFCLKNMGIQRYFKIWISRLFRSAVRSSHHDSIREMDDSIRSVLAVLDRDGCRFLKFLYPDLQWNNKRREFTFIELGEKLLQSVEKGHKNFKNRLRQACAVPLYAKVNFWKKILNREKESRIREDFELTLDMAYKELGRERYIERREKFNFAKPVAFGLKNAGLCSYCRSPGIFNLWDCNISNPARKIHSGLVDSIVYFVSHILTYLIYLILFKTPNKNTNDLPWSHNKWLQNYCLLSMQGRVKVDYTGLDNIDDILEIKKKIPILINNDIKIILTMLQSINFSWVRVWVATINHYIDVLEEMDEEINMIVDVRNNTIDYFMEDDCNKLLYMPLHYKSPRIFSLTEQFNTIISQIDQTMEYVEELNYLELQKNLYASKVEKKCEEINQITSDVKLNLLEGDIEFSAWKSINGDNVVNHIIDEVKKIQTSLGKFKQGDVASNCKEIFIEISILNNQSDKLFNRIKEIISTLKNQVQS